MVRPSELPDLLSGSGPRGRSPTVIALAVAATVVVAAVVAVALAPGLVAPPADVDADATNGSAPDDPVPTDASAGTDGDESSTPTPESAVASTPTATPASTSGPDATAAPERTTTPASDAGSDADAGSGSGSGSGSSSNAGAADAPRFSLAVVNATECGTTCRDVTAELSNVGDADATDVVVETTILVEGDEIWTGETDVGTVDAGETATRTERVEIGFLEAAAVESNGGYVTVETEVRWDGGEQTFSERVQAS